MKKEPYYDPATNRMVSPFEDAVQYQPKKPTLKITLTYIDILMPLVIGNIVKIEETEHYLKLIFRDGKETYISHSIIRTFDVEEEVYDNAKNIKGAC